MTFAGGKRAEFGKNLPREPPVELRPLRGEGGVHLATRGARRREGQPADGTGGAFLRRGVRGMNNL